MRGSVHPVLVIPTFNPTGLLGVVFFDNTTNVNVTVTPGQNLTRERKSAFKLFPMTLLTIYERNNRERSAPDGIADEQ